MGLAALGPISTDLYLPSLPSIGREFNASQAEVQATLSIFLIGFACSVLICGTLSDGWGRRPVLLYALAGFSLASIMCAFSPSIEFLWLFRLCQALAAGAGPVITRAIVRDTHHQADSLRMMSYLSAGVGIAPLLGPFIGGILETSLSWRANFAFLSLYSAVGFFLAWLYLPETNPTQNDVVKRYGDLLRIYSLLLRDKLYIGFVLCAGFAFSGMFSFISGSSFVFIQVLHVEPRFFGFYFSLFVLGFISGASLGGRLTKRWISKDIIFAGSLLSLAAGSFLIIAAYFELSLLWQVLPLYPYMVGMGLIGPSAQAASVAPHPQAAGAAGGLLNFLTIICASLTGALLAQIPLYSAFPMYVFMTVGAFLVLVVYLFMNKNQNRYSS